MRAIFLSSPTRFLLSVSVGLFLFSFALAQTSGQRTQPPPPPRPTDVSPADKNASDDSGPMTTFEEELRAKRAIKLAEKEHEQNVGRAREICQVVRELQDRMKHKTSFDRDDLKRLDRIEKLTKKVRGEAGGEEEDVTIDKKPTDAPSAVTQIGETAETLSKSVQNTPRQVVSAGLIDTANVLLQLIRLARTFVN